MMKGGSDMKLCLKKARLPEEIRKWAGGDGITIVSLFSDDEGKRVTRAVAERFGGWHQPADSVEEYARVPKKDASEAERFEEGAEIWKAAAEKLAEAFGAFARETASVDPMVAASAELAAGGLDIRARLEKAVSAVEAEAGKLLAEEREAGRP